MTDEKYDLWYSPTQQRHMLDRGADVLFGQLENGQIVEYTQAVKVGNPLTNIFDDSAYLGRGMFHHVVEHKLSRRKPEDP